MFPFSSLHNIPTPTVTPTSTTSSSDHKQFAASIAAHSANSAPPNQAKSSFENTMQAYQLYLGNQIIRTNETLIEIKGGTANKNLKEMPFNYDRIKSDITREKFDSTMLTQDKIISGQQEIIDNLDNKEKNSE